MMITKKTPSVRRAAVLTAGVGALALWGLTGCFEKGGEKDGVAAGEGGAATRPAVGSVVAGYHRTVQPILQDKCYSCHSGGGNKTGVAFDKLETDESIANNADLWLKVLKNTRSHVMPPAGEDRPTAGEQLALENWIEYSAFGVDAKHLDPGRQVVRRLNRVEYRNTVRELTGVDYEVDTAFPSDDIGYGFDNIGDVLNVSPMLMEKYVEAAQTIVARGVPLQPRMVPVQTIAGRAFSDADEKEKAGPRGGALELSFFNEAEVTHTFEIAEEGDYRVLVNWGIKGSFDFSPGRCLVTYRVDGEEASKAELTWHDEYNAVEPIERHWGAGKHALTIVVHNTAQKSPEAQKADAAKAEAAKPEAAKADAEAAKVEAAKPDAGKAETNTVEVVKVEEAKPEAVKAEADKADAGKADPAAKPRPPRMPPARQENISYRIVKVDLEGPRGEAHMVPTPGYKRFFTREEMPRDAAGQQAYAREILGSFATRAFRRPVPAETLGRLVEIAQSVAGAPDGTFEKGVAQAMVAVLASPRFLYRVDMVEPARERGGKGPFAEVDEYSLASRLSYFLWSTMPDQELMELAGRGELRKNLRGQVERMVADPRSQALVENFTGQWLQSREVTGMAINHYEVSLREGITVSSRNAQVAGPVKAALKQEPEACFAYIMHGDRSVTEFLDSDYVFVNQTLAELYKIPEVTGPEMRKVMLPAGDVRGGALTMGATLMVTSNPTRTSPVKRGKWVLENILGAPIPPPPPDVPALEAAATKLEKENPTLREVLAEHRANPLCASCHDRMDPLGLALENFNAEGSYRTRELDQPIDVSGELYTGEEIHHVGDLKQALVKNHRLEFYRCLTEKLLIYATGRGMEYYDMPTIDRIADQLYQADGRFSVLLFGVIESAPFQEQRVAP